MTAGAAGRDHPVPPQPAPPRAETSPSPRSARRGGSAGPARASTVLADRMAAALVHREPGWRLPRRTALARRYNVSLTEIDAALGDLARRSLVRRLPDGQLCRASPPTTGSPSRAPAASAPGSIRWAARSSAGPDMSRRARRPRTWPGPCTCRAARRSAWSGASCYAGGPGRRVHRLPERTARGAGLRKREQDNPSLGLVLNALPAATVSLEMSPPQPSITPTASGCRRDSW